MSKSAQSFFAMRKIGGARSAKLKYRLWVKIFARNGK